MLWTIDNIQKEVNTMLLNLDLPEYSLPLCTVPIGDGTPYISFENNKYNYIYSERGYEFSRKITESIDELLYWIMYDFIHKLAVKYELMHRIPKRDSRRIYFPKIVELMDKINIEWGLKVKKELDDILKNSPYDDNSYF